MLDMISDSRSRKHLNLALWIAAVCRQYGAGRAPLHRNLSHLGAECHPAWRSVALRISGLKGERDKWEASGGVEAHRVEPQRAQPGPHLLFGEVRDGDGLSRRVAAVLALAGEVGPHLKDVADVAGDDERRPGGGEASGVARGLLKRLLHLLEPAVCAPARELLVLPDEAVGAVEVDELGVRVVLHAHGALKAVARREALFALGGRGLGLGHVQQRAQLPHKRLRVGPLARLRGAPLADERGDLVGGGLHEGSNAGDAGG
jgi:hypothetical protein